MVNLFTNCDGCANKPACQMRFDLQSLCEDIHEVDFKHRMTTVNFVSINIKCNKYQTDYGKGTGN